jgi:hypothetical protein
MSEQKLLLINQILSKISEEQKNKDCVDSLYDIVIDAIDKPDENAESRYVGENDSDTECIILNIKLFNSWNKFLDNEDTSKNILTGLSERLNKFANETYPGSSIGISFNKIPQVWCIKLEIY